MSQGPKGLPVGAGGCAYLGVEAAAEIDGGGEADAGCDCLDRQVRFLEQGACRGHSAGEQPGAGA